MLGNTYTNSETQTIEETQNLSCLFTVKQYSTILKQYFYYVAKIITAERKETTFQSETNGSLKPERKGKATDSDWSSQLKMFIPKPHS